MGTGRTWPLMHCASQVTSDSSGQIMLLQEDMSVLHPDDVPWLSIGFSVYPTTGLAIKEPTGPLFETGHHRMRDISLFCTLEAGYYIVVPSVTDEGGEGKFVLSCVAESMWSFRGPVFWGQDSQWCLCD